MHTMLGGMTTPEITRRTALKAGVWTAPVIAAAVAVPMHAASIQPGFFVVTEAYWDVAANEGAVTLQAFDRPVSLRDVVYGYREMPVQLVDQLDPTFELPGQFVRFIITLKPNQPVPTGPITIDFQWMQWFPDLSVTLPMV